jgi:hypothetical protein
MFADIASGGGIIAAWTDGPDCLRSVSECLNGAFVHAEASDIAIILNAEPVSTMAQL